MAVAVEFFHMQQQEKLRTQFKAMPPCVRVTTEQTNIGNTNTQARKLEWTPCLNRVV